MNIWEDGENLNKIKNNPKLTALIKEQTLSPEIVYQIVQETKKPE